MKTPHSFTIKGEKFLLDHKPFHIISGEIHYPRVPRAYWQHRIQAAKAMGLNTICTYVFWNAHESQPGKFDFTGNLDVAAFVKMIQEAGLYAIVRPGPYVCAEWDFGGLPWWLLADPQMQVRCSYPGYMTALKRFILRVGKELAPLQISRGGPLLMTQVENEYGVFGNDRAYLATLKKYLEQAGFRPPFFRCDWPNPTHLIHGEQKNVLTVANFGSDAPDRIKLMRKRYPNSPAMTGEFWMGWFDKWGAKRSITPHKQDDPHLKDLEWMLQHGVNFNFYMFHGGTSFGFNAGTNHWDCFEPTVTSYDTGAVLNESGRPRPLYFQMRDLIWKERQAAGEKVAIPEVPEAPHPIIRIPKFKLDQVSPVLPHLKNGLKLLHPKPMEMLGLGHGCIVYRKKLDEFYPGEYDLTLRHVHDNAYIFLDGKRIATVDRRNPVEKFKFKIQPNKPNVLEILVAPMGHINFGPRIIDRKGITESIEIGLFSVTGWEVCLLPLDQMVQRGLPFGARSTKTPPKTIPVWCRGTFTLKQIGDTFFDLRGWGKGWVWINGHNLGRYWSIGPQQTLYVPAPWLKKGRNEVTILDLENPGTRTLSGLPEPILDQVPEPTSPLPKNS